ncbi:MAG: hypothetical protein KDD33_10940 [Bdellovibrionales bacterium]|nr:hypothetical protein [Bdellovibrionales bacterium]
MSSSLFKHILALSCSLAGVGVFYCAEAKADQGHFEERDWSVAAEGSLASSEFCLTQDADPLVTPLLGVLPRSSTIFVGDSIAYFLTPSPFYHYLEFHFPTGLSPPYPLF